MQGRLGESGHLSVNRLPSARAGTPPAACPYETGERQVGRAHSTEQDASPSCTGSWGPTARTPAPLPGGSLGGMHRVMGLELDHGGKVCSVYVKAELG